MKTMQMYRKNLQFGTQILLKYDEFTTEIVMTGSKLSNIINWLKILLEHSR